MTSARVIRNMNSAPIPIVHMTAKSSANSIGASVRFHLPSSACTGAYMPECDDVSFEQNEKSLDHYLAKSNVRGLILTGLDRDHACPAGVESILTRYQPNWVMYPKVFKETDAAGDVFATIARHEKRRANTSRPLVRQSVRVDRLESRNLTGLASYFTFELFSPHMDDMDSSNNSSIVLKLVGLDQNGFSYPITGDTESERS